MNLYKLAIHGPTTGSSYRLSSVTEQYLTFYDLLTKKHKMMKDFERLDIRELLELYMQESKDFSTALSKGASWEELHNKRQIIKHINDRIRQKYAEHYGQSRRRDDQPPHGD